MGKRMSCDVGGKLEKRQYISKLFYTKLLRLLTTFCAFKRKYAKVPKYSNEVLLQTSKFKFPTYLFSPVIPISMQSASPLPCIHSPSNQSPPSLLCLSPELKRRLKKEKKTEE